MSATDLSATEWLHADWEAPPRVRTLVTTRAGGVSPAPFDSMNLGDHVGDAPEHVAQNRALLRARLPAEPAWLTQVHGTRVLNAADVRNAPEADASVAGAAGVVCAVMTADCLPVLFCDRAGTRVAAAHAGWRGLCAGVLEATVAAMHRSAGEVLAWMGPAIGPDAFEVGAEVRAAFMAHDPASDAAFTPIGEGQYLADLYRLARQRLEALGIRAISGGEHCTVIDRARFFSYRRDGRTGRMASLIWLED